IRGYDKAIELQRDYLPSYAYRGLARFYAADFAGARGDFKRVVDEEPSSYSVLLLYLSRGRAGSSEGRAELQNAAGKLSSQGWPYPIVELYLDRKSPEAVQNAASKPDERCEAQFYIGEWYLLRGMRPPAAKMLQGAVGGCPKHLVEYRGAAEELKRL